MTEQRIGAFIAQLRRERQMTQNDLAAHMGVTDKAVSKWERNSSYPDVTTLPKLARVLGVTTDELLGGRRNGADIVAEANGVVAERGSSNKFVEKVRAMDKAKIQRLVFASVSALAMIGIATVLIVNTAIQFSTNNAHIWWPYAVGGILVVWLPYGVFVIAKRARVVSALVAFVVLLTGYAFLVAHLTMTSGWIGAVYAPVLVLVLVAGAIITGMIRRRVNGWFVAAVTLALLAVVSFATSRSVDGYTARVTGDATAGADLLINVITTISLLLLAGLIALVGLIVRKKTREA